MTAPAYLLADPLAARLIASGQSEDLAYAAAERAAIMENCAGMSRARAESRDLVDVTAEKRRRAERAFE